MARLSKGQQECQSSFGHLLQVLARRMNKLMRQRLAEIDIDLKTFASLRMLAGRDGINQRELSKLLEFPGYHTSRSVDALVEHGFVERRPAPNSRRSILIFLPPQGHEKIKQLPDIIDSVNHEFLAHLNEAEKRTTIDLLRKIIYTLEEDDLNTQVRG